MYCIVLFIKRLTEFWATHLYTFISTYVRDNYGFTLSVWSTDSREVKLLGCKSKFRFVTILTLAQMGMARSVKLYVFLYSCFISHPKQTEGQIKFSHFKNQTLP